MASGDLVTRVYANFRGVDFRGDEINLARSPDSKNMWKDYREIDSIRTRPEMRHKCSFGGIVNGIDFKGTVHGIYFYKAGETDMMIVHADSRLYKVDGAMVEVLHDDVASTKSNAFVYNNVWYFMDGYKYLRYDGSTIKDVEGYVPTTSVERKPSGGGELHEDVNLLTDYRINTFIGDGESTVFHLDVKKLKHITVEVWIDDEKLPMSDEGVIVSDIYAVEVDKSKATVTIKKIKTQSNGKYGPPAPKTDGQGNVKIKFEAVPEKDDPQNLILNCTLIELFDNRVFFSGNPDYPNVIWHSSLNDPTYCSDLDYYNEGLDTAAVKGMVAGNNALWVFKEASQANTTIFYHTPTIDSEYGKIYPNTHSSISVGCVGKAINFNDDIVFFSNRGMEGISGDIATEQVIAHRSSLVDRKLLAEENYSDMILEEWEGYLLVIIGNRVYLADSRAVFTNEDHFEYEWFYWELPHEITCAKTEKGILYLGTTDGLYILNDNESKVEGYWTTPKDKFKHPHYVKTTNKRGCVVEATGDIALYAKTDKTEFELIDTYECVTDHFVGRIKRKKFKDIQLKFYSATRFSLETATLECFVGGYVKR